MIIGTKRCCHLSKMWRRFKDIDHHNCNIVTSDSQEYKSNYKKTDPIHALHYSNPCPVKVLPESTAIFIFFSDVALPSLDEKQISENEGLSLIWANDRLTRRLVERLECSSHQLHISGRYPPFALRHDFHHSNRWRALTLETRPRVCFHLLWDLPINIHHLLHGVAFSPAIKSDIGKGW